MATREVLRMGDARLLRIAEEVSTFNTAELHALLADMRDTMHAENGVGLAAPQIGVNLRVVIFEVAGNPRYPEAEAVPQTVLINPVITALKNKMEEDWEGCLSVPGLRGIVPRYTHIRYQGFDEYGTAIDRTVSDFHARVVQHECDHLDGILYPMRMKDLSKLGYTDVMSAVELPQSSVIRNLIYALLALLLVLLIGTIGYRLLGAGHNSWVDCFYMTFITIASIGFSEIVDVTHYEYGRLFTVLVSLMGMGVLGYVLSTLTAYVLESDLNVGLRRKKMQQKIAKLEDHFIVCGAGRVGSNVLDELSVTGRPCVVIEPEMEALNKYLETHPEQLYLQGDATDDDVLLSAGLMRARGVFAVAHDDNDNLVISLSVKQLNPGLRVVARCHDLKNSEKVRRAGADEIVSPDFTGGLRLVSAMVRPQVENFLDDMLKSANGLRMEEVTLPDNLESKQLSVLHPGGQDFVVLAIRQQQGKWAFNPHGRHAVYGGDVLMVMTTPEGRNQLEQLIHGMV